MNTSLSILLEFDVRLRTPTNKNYIDDCVILKKLDNALEFKEFTIFYSKRY